MLLIGRFGVVEVSIRLKTTAAAAAFAFFETKSRPRVVDAHSVELSPEPRASQPTLPPLRLPRAEVVSDKPSTVTQSPHVKVSGKSPVNSLQCDSKVAKSGPTPSVFVRHTW